jgi:uncharacterized membrane protein YheB (UPF0754 family)
MVFAIPFISAGIGWFTNWLAIKMLFNPKEKTNFILFSWQGLFPANQAEISAKVGKMVAEELLSPQDVKAVANSPEQLLKLRKLVEGKMDEYLFEVFPSRHKILSALIPNSKMNEMKMELLEEVDKAVPEMIDAYLKTVEEKFDVAKIIFERMSVLEVDKLEKLLMSILAKEFRFVELLGGVIGFLIGLMQVLMIKLSLI